MIIVLQIIMYMYVVKQTKNEMLKTKNRNLSRRNKKNNYQKIMKNVN